MGVSAGLMAKTFASQLSMLSQAIPRAIVIGANTGIAYGTTAHVGKVVKALEENVKTFEAAIKKYQADTNASDSSSLSEDSAQYQAYQNTLAGINAPSQFTMMAQSNQIDGALGCQSLASNGQLNLMGGCQSPIKINAPTFPSTFNKDLAKAFSTSMDMVNAINKGDFQNANLHAGQLGQMSHRVKEVKDGLVKELDKILEKKGEKKSFNQLVNENIKAQENAIMNSMQKSGADIASLTRPQTPTSAKKEKKEDQSTTASVPLPSPVSDLPILSSGIGTEEAPAENSDLALADNENALNQFDVGDADISKANQENIFDLLSKRYLLSYPKILKRKESAGASNP
jgi:hypothetical protein